MKNLKFKTMNEKMKKQKGCGMNPARTRMQRCIEDGSFATVSKTMSVAALLCAIGTELMDIAGEKLYDHGLLIGPIKQHHNRAMHAFDLYFAEFSSLVTDRNQKMNLFTDIDDLRNVIYRWAEMPEEYMRETKNVLNEE